MPLIILFDVVERRMHFVTLLFDCVVQLIETTQNALSRHEATVHCVAESVHAVLDVR
jgi:hypothetical protein